MPTQQYEVQHTSVESLLVRIKDGKIVFPEIQRPFVWNSKQVCEFIDSLYLGYPVGYIIAWQTQDAPLRVGRSLGDQYILIDGQQRVTALMTALLGQSVLDNDYKEDRIRIAFDPCKEEFAVANSANEKDPVWIPDISVLFSREAAIPKFARDYCDQIQYNDKDSIIERLWRLTSIKDNQIGYINLKNDLDLKTVQNIFVRVNSTGRQLNTADYVMSGMAANEKYDGHLLRKCIDYFCHLAKRPEAYDKLSKDKEFADTVFFHKMSWLKDRPDDILLSIIYRHAARRLHD